MRKLQIGRRSARHVPKSLKNFVLSIRFVWINT
jgi:hypothetical protein